MAGTSYFRVLYNYVIDADISVTALLKRKPELPDTTVSIAEIQAFEQRRERRLSGESKTYSWGEAKGIITGKKD